jgi:hypothetical protein
VIEFTEGFIPELVCQDRVKKHSTMDNRVTNE